MSKYSKSFYQAPQPPGGERGQGGGGAGARGGEQEDREAAVRPGRVREQGHRPAQAADTAQI